MTLDQIIEKAKTYRVADTSGEHNFGEVMEHLRDALEAISDPNVLPSHGDPTVLRLFAKEAILKVQK